MTNSNNDLDYEFIRDCISQILIADQQFSGEESECGRKILALYISRVLKPSAIGKTLTRDQEQIIKGFMREVISTDPELQEKAKGTIYGI